MAFEPVVNLYNQYTSGQASDPSSSFDSSAFNSGVSNFVNDLFGVGDTTGNAPGGLTWDQYNSWVASQQTQIPTIPVAAFDTDLAAYGIRPVSSSGLLNNMPADEAAYRAEYALRDPTYDGAGFTPAHYSGPVGSSGWEDSYSQKIWGDKTYNGMNYYDYMRSIWSGLGSSLQNSLTTQFQNEQAYQSQANYDDYLAWVNQQGQAYNTALDGFQSAQNNMSAAQPQAFLGSGAPTANDQLSGELAKLYGMELGQGASGDPKLSPYNPLKSDWNGSVNLGGLLQGLFQSLFAPDKVPPVELLTSPAFEYKGGLMKGDRPGMDSEGAGLQDLFPWQRTDYSDMMADYDTPNAPSEPRKQTEAPSRVSEQVLASDPTIRKELEKKMAQDAFVEQRKQQQEALYKQKPNVAIQTDQNARPKQTFNPTQQQVNLGWKAWA